MSHKHSVAALRKLLLYVVGHRPDEYGLVPDSDGLVSLKTLQQALGEETGWSYVRRSDIMEVVYTDARHRLEIVDDHIRVLNADGAGPQVVYKPVDPPSMLFHGIRRRSYPHVLRHGLSSAKDNAVVCANEHDMALRIGKRRDPRPVVLQINAHKAAENGVVFYQAYPLLYVVDYIAADYVTGPPLSSVQAPHRAPAASTKPKPIDQHPGSVMVDITMQPIQKRPAGKKDRDRSRKYRRRKRQV